MRLIYASLFVAFLCVTCSRKAVAQNADTVDIGKTIQLVWNVLVKYYKEANFGQEPPAKFYSVIYQIQRAVTDEIVSRNPRALLLTPEQRQKELLHFIKTAGRGGDIDFARTTFGKSLFAFMKSKLNLGLKPVEVQKAATKYMEKIKKEIGSDTFEEVFAKRGDATLMFVIDTTGSMKNEILAAKAIAKRIITETREFDVDYILSPFGDPGYGPITYRNQSQREDFVEAIDNLDAKGGGDCPELTFTGMLEALNAGPRFGSPMFVFTDANAKDATIDNINAVKVAAYSSGSTINFFGKTESCGKNIDIKEFHDVASFTSGQVFALTDTSELRKLSLLVRNSLLSSTVISSANSRPITYSKPILKRVRRAIPYPKQYVIPVDNTVGRLVVSVTVQHKDTARLVSLRDPSGIYQETNVSLSRAKVYEIKSPAPGVWTLYFPPETGVHDYIARALSKKLIQFGFIFFHRFVRKNTLIPVSHPLLGDDVHLYLSLTGLENIKPNTLTVDLLREDGSKLRGGLRLSHETGTTIFNTTFPSFDETFKIRIRGRTIEGYAFQRLSEKTVKAQPIMVRALYGDRDYTVLNGRKMLLIFEVLNRGPGAVFKFDCIAKYGTPLLRTKSRRIRRRGYFRLHYFAPKGSHYKGRVDQLVVSVRGVKNPVYVFTAIKVLIL
ncbi:hemicentin-1-like isoform X2 [Rhopilema esculentum]|uniref:hemicentin-1-like isoform X2 n=1 Tax=Rhopilema esculentum TaxID=499914 RepID=UPI0031E3FF5A